MARANRTTPRISTTAQTTQNQLGSSIQNGPRRRRAPWAVRLGSSSSAGKVAFPGLTGEMVWRSGRPRQLPAHFGERFSRKAAIPSLASALPKAASNWDSSAPSAPSRGWSMPSATALLIAAKASGAR
jgi:hypothetical protein